MNSSRWFALSLFLVTLLVMTELGVRWWPANPPAFILPTYTSGPGQVPVYRETFLSMEDTAAVHAASITQRRDSKLMAVWYAGSREGAKDVSINTTVIDPLNGSRTPPRPLVVRDIPQSDTWRYIRKLGNPVIHTLPDGRLMLLYVSTSYGGWSISNINLNLSDDNGRTWSRTRRLVTTPFLNLSTLVRGRPINYRDDRIAIPVYHELFGKFSQLLVLDQDGKVLDKSRMSWGRDNIQPSIQPLDEQHAIALHRDSSDISNRIRMNKTGTAGQQWSTPRLTSLPNPNASVATGRDDHGNLLAVFNNDPDERYDLSLAVSPDNGEHWRVIHVFDKATPKPKQKLKFSYPYLIRDRSGGFHLVYTWHKRRIKYVHFNQAWLDSII